MLALDLFNTKYERDLAEGAVDDLEARRIDTLNDRMQELLSRAKESQYKNNPAALAGLKKEYQRFKDERDSYYKVREAGIPGNLPADQIPGKEDLLKGKGRTYYEGAEDYAGIYSPEAIVLGKKFCEHYNITDDGDVQLAVEIIDSYLDEFKATNTPVDLKKIRSGVADAFRQVYRGMGPGPSFRKRFQEAEQSPRALGVANFQRLVKANMGNIPTVNLEFIRPEENFKLDQRGLDLISDYYDGLENDQAKNYFIYRVLPSGEETLKVLKQLGFDLAQAQQQTLPGIPAQGELSLSEQQNQKKNESAQVTFEDVKTARQVQRMRELYPSARSDIEALAQAELDSTERSRAQISNIRSANSKQDELLKQIMDLDREQNQEIINLDTENDSLEKQLNRVQGLNDRLAQMLGQMPTTKTAKKTTKASTPVDHPATINLIPGAPVDQSNTVQPEKPADKPTDNPSVVSAIPAMARQIQGLQKPAPAIRGSAPGIRAANDSGQQTQKVSGSDMQEHGGGIGPRQRWQDLMPEQMNPEDDDWYDDEDEDLRLRSGDYVRDTMDGESGEIFRMQGDPEERRVRILDRDGRGWYIEPSRLTRVDPQDSDVQRYFGKHRQRDMDESGVAEGWSDAMVARRTGQPRTPYAVYIKGKKWKDFENEDLARAVANKLRAKFKADGRDPETITIAPTGMTEAEKEPTTRQELLNRVDKIQRMMSQERNPANLQILRKELEMIKQRYQHLREDNASEAVERAILNRIMVAHTNLLMKFGPDKVMQAAEEVAYNVGDVDEIGTSDVSAYVAQVRQILGDTP